jgi:hypothetical protein
MLMIERKRVTPLMNLKCSQEALFFPGVDPQTELIVIHHKTSRTMRMALR